MPNFGYVMAWAGAGLGDNDIGIPGTQGFGVGIAPSLPSGFSEMVGTTDPTNSNYGNYQFSDNSVMGWVPLFYYKIATDNTITIAKESDYANEAAANAAGFALHRAFKDGGVTKRGFFVDKYQASNNSGTASSLKNGNPLSTDSAHHPIGGLTGSPANNYSGVIDAAKTRGARFQCTTRFMYSALAILSMAHGQAASAATYCAWYDAAGVTNFLKGNNNNALGDVDDGTIVYTSDGYSNAGKTGSGTPFERTTHNGQACGIADLNGNMWEVSLGLTRPGTTYNEAINDGLGTAKFHILKESVAIADITGGWNDDPTYGVSPNDHWGTDAFLDTNFQEIDLAHIGSATGWKKFGNSTNQVLSEAVSGDPWLMTALAIYKDANGGSAGGTNLFGVDGLYEYHRANLCVVSGGGWGGASLAGVWTTSMGDSRSTPYDYVGFRAACY